MICGGFGADEEMSFLFEQVASPVSTAAGWCRLKLLIWDCILSQFLGFCNCGCVHPPCHRDVVQKETALQAFPSP